MIKNPFDTFILFLLLLFLVLISQVSRDMLLKGYGFLLHFREEVFLV